MQQNNKELCKQLVMQTLGYAQGVNNALPREDKMHVVMDNICCNLIDVMSLLNQKE